MRKLKRIPDCFVMLAESVWRDLHQPGTWGERLRAMFKTARFLAQVWTLDDFELAQLAQQMRWIGAMSRNRRGRV